MGVSDTVGQKLQRCPFGIMRHSKIADGRPLSVEERSCSGHQCNDRSIHDTLATAAIALRTLPLARLEQKLLEQLAQLEWRTLAAVAHDGRRDVARAIDLPAANRRTAQSRIAPRAALSLLASNAALALARDQLPAGTRAGARRILERDEAAAVESDDVETTIFCGLVERAAHGEAVAG